MKKDKWKEAADAAMDAAGRLHLLLLRFLTAGLTIFLICVPVTGIWMISNMRRYSAFSDFLGYIRHGASMLSLTFFLLSYMGMFLTLLWLCLVCRRLRIAKRLIVWCLLWIPVLNYGLALYVNGLARSEIDHNLHKIRLDDIRAEKHVCETKYPLLLVHGVGFRDYRYFNYWGRIPRELVRNGAKVCYGQQEAWGTIEDNGAALKEQILMVCKETGAKKVNIIAHSKGGLDSRYMIHSLFMAPYVASLTTINTPHHGSAIVDFLMGLPDGIYRWICCYIDGYFRKFGDKNPNTYVASRQLSCSYMEEFNRLHPDAEGVYYQSYASLMKHGASSKLLCISYWLLKRLDGPNDGLVTAESARWTNFQGILQNRYLRGISHGDMIDLTREDYREFHVLEFYIQLVQKLAEMGF